MSTTFDLDAGGIVRNAYQSVGVVPAGQDPDTAKYIMGRELLDVVLKSWESLGIFLSKLERYTQSLTSGTASYSAPADTLDIDTHTPYVTVDNVDIPLKVIPRGEYMALGQKDVEGVPAMMYVEKGATITFFLYPVPNATVTSITYPRTLIFTDMSTSATTTGLPSKYLRPLILDLAVMLCPHFGMLEKQRALRADLKIALNDARQDDTERGNMRLRPSYGMRWTR